MTTEQTLLCPVTVKYRYRFYWHDTMDREEICLQKCETNIKKYLLSMNINENSKSNIFFQIIPSNTCKLNSISGGQLPFTDTRWHHYISMDPYLNHRVEPCTQNMQNVFIFHKCT